MRDLLSVMSQLLRLLKLNLPTRPATISLRKANGKKTQMTKRSPAGFKMRRIGHIRLRRSTNEEESEDAADSGRVVSTHKTMMRKTRLSRESDK